MGDSETLIQPLTHRQMKLLLTADKKELFFTDLKAEDDGATKCLVEMGFLHPDLTVTKEGKARVTMALLDN